MRGFLLVLMTSGIALAAPKPGTVAKVTPPAQVKTTYPSMVKIWHTPAEGTTAPSDADGRVMLSLVAINGNDKLAIPAKTERGGFSAYDLDRTAKLLHDGSGNQHPIEPRLLDVVYRIQTHFAAHEIRIVSGYRAPKPGNASNHGKGRAIDLVVPGTSDEEVAKFARELGFVGVGIYPTSGFVHVDVRDKSYFWIDSSGPGKRNREKGILGDLALKSDQAALARGEHGTPSLTVVWNVDAAAQSLAPVAQPQLDDDDDL